MLNISRPLGGRSELSFCYKPFTKALICSINVCDLPEKYESLRATYDGNEILHLS